MTLLTTPVVGKDEGIKKMGIQIENTSRSDTKELRRLFSHIIAKSPLDTYQKRWLREGLYISVQNGKYSRVRGRIYPDAVEIHRKGKPIRINSYIKLYVFTHTTIEDIGRTFAHELSHFRDWHREFFDHIKVPYGKEKRAQAFADRVVKKLR